MKPRDPLDSLLREVVEPGRSEAYWTEFSGAVGDRLRSLEAASVQPRPLHPPAHGFRVGMGRWIAGLGLGLAAAFGLVQVVGWIRWGTQQPTDPTFRTAELEDFRRVIRELGALFPGQVRGVVFEGGQIHLVLSEVPTPASGPLEAVRICRPDGCITVVGSAGQSIPVSRGVVDVFADPAGRLLVVGPDFAWRNGEPTPSGYTRITLSPLETPL